MTRLTSQISPSVSKSLWKVGTYNALTDTFTSALDLNDGATFFVSAYKLPQPQKVYARSSNIREQGESIFRWQYQNRHITLSIKLLYFGGNNTAGIVAAVRSLIQTIEKPPYRLAFALPGATQYTYADVLAVSHNISVDTLTINQGAISEIQIDFECKPGLAGDRITLQNLLFNPGFEAPSGPGVVAFNDSFANTNAYSVVSGGAPTIGYNNTYVDIVQSDTPLHYYRLDEASGTTCADISGLGGVATYTASPTLGQAGAISGDTDTAVLFNGTTQYAASTTASSLPTGSAAWTLECWLWIVANPASQTCMALAIGTQSSNAGAYIGVKTTGVLECGTFSGAQAVSNAAVATGAWHHVAVTYAGGTNGVITLYLDGVAQTATATTTAALAYSGSFLAIGAMSGSSIARFLNCKVDEACVYGTALSSTRITAHYNAGHTGATGTQTNIMSVPSGATCTFGSPNWQAVNTWQVRFQWVTGSAPGFYLHYVDANNWIFAQVLSTGLLRIRQNVAGTITVLASTSCTMTHEAWYWMTITQFPIPPNATISTALTPQLQVTLSCDQQGVIGALVGTIGPVAGSSNTVAVAGKAGFMASGAAMNIGGPYTNVQSLALFGPGGWVKQDFGTGVSSLAWDQTAANTYPSGPVTSFGAARLDLPPAGTVDVCVRQYATGFGLALVATAAPASVGHTLSISAYVKSTGLSANALIRCTFTEYNSSGAQLVQFTNSGLSGNQASWTQLATTYTVSQSTTAYVDVALRVSDTVTPGESAGASVWFDNAQVYDQTATGATSMPYCELRFPQSPAQLLVSGLVGDIEAPCQFAFGTYLTSWPGNSSLSYAIGRRSQSSATAQLVGPSYGSFTGTPTPQAFQTLDSTSYGGWYEYLTLTNGGWNPRAFSMAPNAAQGYFHLIFRFLSQQSSGNLANLVVRGAVNIQDQPWIPPDGLSLWTYYGSYLNNQVSASNAWLVLDGGQIVLPPANAGALMDLTQNYFVLTPQWVDNTGSSYQRAQMSWQLLLPVDGGLLLGQMLNPSNTPYPITNSWLWGYFDGLGTQVGQTYSWTYSVEAGASSNEAHSTGGQGTTSTGAISVNSAADPWLTLDPTLDSGANANQIGVNQFAAYTADQNASVLPFCSEVQYTPLYLFPR